MTAKSHPIQPIFTFFWSSLLSNHCLHNNNIIYLGFPCLFFGVISLYKLQVSASNLPQQHQRSAVMMQSYSIWHSQQLSTAKGWHSFANDPAHLIVRVFLLEFPDLFLQHLISICQSNRCRRYESERIHTLFWDFSLKFIITPFFLCDTHTHINERQFTKQPVQVL